MLHDRRPTEGAYVWIREHRWRVDRIRPDGAVLALDVSREGRRRTFLTPFDRVWRQSVRRRPTRIRRQQAIARLAGIAGRAPGARAIDAAIDARVALFPYQLEPALAMAVRGDRRILVADDVGLGKTIQAAFVVCEIVRRVGQARVLILAPASLTAQWREELATRFGLDAAVADRDALDAEAARAWRGESPWRGSGVRIASPDFLKQPHVFDAMPALSWDLLVIDEAHTVCGDSERHARCQALALRARRVLLLTATPHDGDAPKFGRLLALGDTGAGDPLIVFRRTRADVGLPSTSRVRRQLVSLSAEERRVLDGLDRFAGVRARTSDAAGLALLVAVLRKRALSTSRALAISIARRLAWLDARGVSHADGWRQSSLPLGDDDEVSEEELRALTSDTGLDPARERDWLARLSSLATAATRYDSRIARLLALLARTREPAIVFTEFRDSLDAVRERLQREHDVAAIYGAQSPSARHRELHRFLSGGARVLVATDVAGVGLNLQARARWVITFDLPWNPIRLDQRLGRVDRIGQTRSAHHTLLVAKHAQDARVLDRLKERSTIARRALDGTPASDTAAPPSHPQVPPEPCRDFRRVAMHHARSLSRRRALAAHWCAEAIAASCGYARGRFLGGDLILVFGTSLVDLSDRELERRIVVCRIDAGPPRDRDAAIERARQVAARVVERRRARLARWMHAAEARGLARDRAIDAALDISRAAPVDVGLFDRRVERALEHAATMADHAAREERRRRRARRLASACRAGTPALLLILEAR